MCNRRTKRISFFVVSLFVIMTIMLTVEGGAKATGGEIDISSAFPDSTFREYVRTQFDKNSDGKLDNAELAEVLSIDVSYTNVRSLKGIEFFTELEYLNCTGYRLSSLDVSKNLKLKTLICESQPLKVLDVSKNTALEYLDCDKNPLTSLNVSKNTKLNYLSCSGGYECGEICVLDVSHNTQLVTLWCSYNKISSLNITNNTLLETLICDNNQISSLNISNNTFLKNLSCDNNQISGLNISNNTLLEVLSCVNNQISSLNLIKNVNLTKLYCGSNPISSLNVSQNSYLSKLDCEKCNLSHLDVSSNTDLHSLNCGGNQLTSLNVDWYMQNLYCEDNQLTELDVSECIYLSRLRCGGNKLVTLRFGSNHDHLIEVSCSNNKLTSLNVSNLSEMSHLSCSGNLLTSLILCENGSLYSLNCSNNKLTSLDVGNNPLSGFNGNGLYCANNNLKSLNLSKATKMTVLECQQNQLTSLTLPEGDALDLIDCSDNKLTMLIVNKNTGLSTLRCNNNQLTQLDVSACPLYSLECSNNKLTGLTIGDELNYLTCDGNMLTQLVFDGATELSELDCRNNKITLLNTSGCAELFTLKCEGNQLSQLDLSNNRRLHTVFALENPLKNVTIGMEEGYSENVFYLPLGTKVNMVASSEGVSSASYHWMKNDMTSSAWIESTSGSGTNSYTHTVQDNFAGNRIKCLIENGSTYMFTSTYYFVSGPYLGFAFVDDRLYGDIIGETLVASVYEASGVEPLQYQWQVLAPGSDTWKNASAPSAKTPEFSFKIQAGHEGYQLRYIITDANGQSSCSDSIWSISIAPHVTSDPQSITVEAGSEASFSVTATGINLEYQWQVWDEVNEEWKNSLAASAKTPTFHFVAQNAHDGKRFRCVVKRTLDEENGYWWGWSSEEAFLTVVSGKPQIITQPTSKTVKVGETAQFTINAQGTGTLKYQWQVKSPSATAWTNSAATSAKTATYGLATQAVHNGYRVRCVVTDSKGRSTTSSEVLLTVNPAITTQPSAQTVKVGEVASFNIVAKGAGSLKYQWQAYNPNTKTWTNSSSASAKTAKLSVTAQAGHNGFKFRCVVTDGNGNKTTSNAVTLKVNPAITTQPTAKTVPVGGSAEFSIVAKGAGTLKYQWQAYNPNTKTWVNSGAASAKTANFYFTAQTGHQGFKFRCVITDGNGNKTTSNAVLLTVRPGLTAQPNNATVSVGSTVQFTIGAKGCGTLSYQWQVWDVATQTWKNSASASAKTAKFTFTAQTGHNGKQFRCIVTDVNGNKTYSRTVTLTVK